MNRLGKLALTAIFAASAIYSYGQRTSSEAFGKEPFQKSYSKPTSKELRQYAKEVSDEVRMKGDFMVLWARWQTPKETDSLNTGDCNDMAPYLIEKKLDKRNIESYLALGIKDLNRYKDRKDKLDYTTRADHMWTAVTQGHNYGDTTFIVDPATAALVFYMTTPGVQGNVPPGKYVLMKEESIRNSNLFMLALSDYEKRWGRKIELMNFKANSEN